MCIFMLDVKALLGAEVQTDLTKVAIVRRYLVNPSHSLLMNTAMN